MGILKCSKRSSISTLVSEFYQRIDIILRALLNLGKAQKVYDITRMTAEELKKVYEERLAQQEEEHEAEVRGINERNEKVTMKNIC